MPLKDDPHDPNNFRGYFPPPPLLNTKPIKDFVHRAASNGSYYLNKHRYASSLFAVAIVACCCYLVYKRYYGNNLKNELPGADVELGSKVALNRRNYIPISTLNN